MNAWYLEVNRTDGIIIQVMKNPTLMNTTLNATVSNNMLWHLDELVYETKEQLAWRQTLSIAA